jgi:PAS domain-containing protein
MESERLRATAELQTFIETANAPIFGIDTAGLLNVCNPRAAAILGYAPNDAKLPLGSDPCEVALIAGGVAGAMGSGKGRIVEVL